MASYWFIDQVILHFNTKYIILNFRYLSLKDKESKKDKFLKHLFFELKNGYIKFIMSQMPKFYKLN